MKILNRLLIGLGVLLASSHSLWAYAYYRGGHSCSGAKVYLVLLLGLALGYLVLHFAEKESVKYLKIVGRVVAGVIFLVSLTGLACKIGSHVCQKSGCGYQSSSAGCSYHGSGASSETEESAEKAH